MIMKQVNIAMNIKQVNEASKPIANTRICFEVRAPSSTSPPSPEGFSNHYNFHKELQPHRSTQLLNHTPLVQR